VTLVTVNVAFFFALAIEALEMLHRPVASVVQLPEPLTPPLHSPVTVAPDTAA
jgi:hypothetical protein